MRRALLLPAEGTLLISTDVHGNGEDLRRLRERFLLERARDPRCHWVVLGDLVHGPSAEARAEQPELYDYPDESPALVAMMAELRAAYPDHVHFVLGNHDYSHIGGPRTRKFYDDEAAALEARMSEPEREALRALFRAALLCVFTPCGALLSHGSPNDRLRSRDDLDAIALPPAPSFDGYQQRVLESLLTHYGQPGPVTARLLARLSAGIPPLRFVVHGHDRDEEGWFTHGANQICPVLFGAPRANKRYLRLDLAARYENVGTLREDHEILRLYA